MGDVMRSEILTEILKDFSRWLDDFRPANRSLGRACALMRRGLEHPEQTDALREAIRLAGEQLYEFDPDLLGGVMEHFRFILFDRCDAARFTEFLRRPRPGTGSPPRELLGWLEEYHGVVRTIIGYVQVARFEVMRELQALQGRPAATGRPSADPSPRHQGRAAGPIPLAELSPGLPGSPCRPAPPASPPEVTGHLGVIVDEERRVLRRAGRCEVADLSRTRLQWHLALALVRRGDRCCSLGHLREVWSAHGKEDDPQKKTIEDAVSRLRKLIRPLGLTVVHKMDLGYGLEELTSGDVPGPGRE
jgi:hypothetical protein